ncbi:MAG: FGGY-family carbohydrate kinase, partial [Anaerolineae bacterium]|nr:FGGY-family carbohydrate kinase [Anaerolineae bacterium]
MPGDLLLALDVGTQSTRAIVFDARGTLISKAQIPILPVAHAPQPGWAEQDPEAYWQAIGEACRVLWAKGEVRPDAIAGVSLTTQRSTLVNVDRDGNALRPAILWTDQRRTEGLKPVGGWWGLLFALAGMKATAAYVQGEAEANWVMTYQPDIWARTYRVMFLSGFLTHRLTGRFIDSSGCLVGYLPFDYKAKDWAKPFDWKWQAIRMERDKLIELAPPTAPLGAITRAAAEATGLPEDLPVIAAASDKACEVLGSGSLDPHLGALSFGTAATINATSRRYLEVIPLLPPFPAAVPDAYNLEIQIFRGFWMVSWFKREFGLLEQMIAEKEGVQVEAVFDRLVEAIPPGSLGLILQPFWSPGLRVPGLEAKGAVIGWGDVHTRGHFYRAIIEGLAYALREGLERISARTGVRVTELRVAGGGSQSDQAMQITADVFGLPAARPHTFEASGLGAAIDAAVGLGLHPDFATAVRDMTRTARVFEPDPASQRLYDDLY